MARVRTKSTSRTVHFKQTYVSDWGQYVMEDYTYAVPSHTHYFSDEVGSKREFHPCLHVERELKPYRLPSFSMEDPEFGNYRIDFEGHPITFYDGSWLDQAPLTPSRAGQISHRALMNAVKQVPMEVSIANFLLELRNPKELLPRIERWLSRKGPSDILLWWKFGIEPTIRDVKAMVGLLARTRKRLDHLRKVNRRTITIRTRDGFQVDQTEFDQSPDPMYPTYWLLWRGTETCRVKVCVNMQVHYELEGLDSPLALLDAMSGALGLTNPAAIVWEAIPFSFVVDWFVRVGDWIEANLDLQPFKGKITVTSCSHSIKWDRAGTYHVPTTPNGDWTPCGTYTIKGYSRNHGLPLGSLVTDGLTAQQQVLGAALLNSLGGTTRKRGRVKT